MKIARLKVSELTRRNKWLGFDIFLLTYITTILFIYPLMYTWSTLFLTIILITTEVILCALVVHEFGHYCAGRRLGGGKITMSTCAGHVDADNWNAFTDEQIQVIAKAGLLLEQTAVALFIALNPVILTGTNTLSWYVTSAVLIAFELINYYANWTRNVLGTTKTDGYWCRHPDERWHSPTSAKK